MRVGTGPACASGSIGEALATFLSVRDRRRAALPAALVVAALVVTFAAAEPTGIQGGDFEWQVSPALDALVRGDLHTFAVNFPLMGPLSLLLRAPFDWLVFSSDVRVVYLVTSLPCLAVFAAAIVWLSRLVQERRGPVIALVVAGLAFVNTAVVRAVNWGHPEDLLCAGLLLAAALAATRARWYLTALLLGMALATKQWALLGLLPIALSAPCRRVSIAAVAIGLAALLTLPFALEAPARQLSVVKAASNPEAFWHTGQATGGVTHVTPPNVVWPFATKRHEFRSGIWVRSEVVSDWVVRAFHLLIGLLVLPLSWVAWRAKRAGPDRWLGVLAAIFLLRCVLDPLNFDYYHVGAIVFLAAWEGLTRRSAPVLTAIAVLGTGITFAAHVNSFAALYQHALWMNVTCLAWMVPLTAYVIAAQLPCITSGGYANIRSRWSSASY